MTPPDPSTIARRIRTAREQIGSRQTVAALTGGQLSAVGLKRLELHGNPTVATLFALIAAGIDPRQILPELYRD